MTASARLALLLATIISLSSLSSGQSQPADVRVTGWWDGIEAGDGVSHGQGFSGIGVPFSGPLWSGWLPPQGSPPNFHWQSHITTAPGATDPCSHFGGGGNVSSIIPLTYANDPNHEQALYIFASPFTDDQYAPDDGPPQSFQKYGPLSDRQGYIVRYANGSYDNVRDTLFLPNRYLLARHGGCDQFGRGTGPFAGAMIGPNNRIYLFFGGQETGQDGGGGPHLIGVAVAPIVWHATGYGDYSGAAYYATFDFQNNKWNPASSRNYSDLQAAGAHIDKISPHLDHLTEGGGGWADCSSSNPAYYDMVHSDFTPILARIGGHPLPTDRFTSMTGTFVGNYFYLFTGMVDGYTLGFRIPYDASTDNGFRRRIDPGHDGAIDVEMWYIDTDHPDGAYHRIDSNRPIAFADDQMQGDNPAVPLANAFIHDTGLPAATYLAWPGGIFEYPVGTGTYWMTSVSVYDAHEPIRIHQLRYDATNGINPWTVSTPYQIRWDGTPCSNCTAAGNYTLPPRYYHPDATVVIYPYTATIGLGYFGVALAQCAGVPGARSDGGLLPFTFDNVDFTRTFGCTYGVSSISTELGSSSSSQTVTITPATATCQWNVAADASWIAVTGASSGSGVGSTAFTVAANIGSSRTGHITIAAKTYTISQQAAPCTSFTIAPTSFAASANGGSQTIHVAGSPSGCEGGTWSASSNVAWITVSPASGSGSGAVTLIVAANSGDARSGTAAIAGQIVTISQPSSTSRRAKWDFDGDGKADLLWRNAGTGEAWLWLMNGSVITAANYLGNLDSTWSIAAVADFTGDGNPDLVWRSNGSGGDTWLWTTSGGHVTGYFPIGNMPPLWTIAAAADFDGDGKADLVWRNTSTGDTWLWLMNGNILRTSHYLGSLDSTWNIAAVADFNGDGSPDLVWRSSGSGGDTWLWTTSGGYITGYLPIANMPPAWTIVAAADFDGDGKADLLWRNLSTADTWIWLMNGNVIASAYPVAGNDLTWNFAAVADFNGDGSPDYIWRSSGTGGDTWLWTTSGGNLAGAYPIGNMSLAWTIANR